MCKLSVFYCNLLDAARKSGKPLSEIIGMIKSAGITALDFDYNDIRNGLPDVIAESGMKVNSIYAFFDYSAESTEAEAKSAVDTASRYGAVMMFVPKIIGTAYAEELKAVTDRNGVFTWLSSHDVSVKTASMLEKLALYAKTKGVKTCVENFDSRRSLTERRAEIEWLFENAPDLGFNPDTGNSATCGEDIAEIYEEFRSRVVNVHCKDRLKTDGAYHVTAAGAGEMPVERIVTDLIENGYDGGFSIEVFDTEDPLTAILDSAENLLKMISRQLFTI